MDEEEREFDINEGGPAGCLPDLRNDGDVPADNQPQMGGAAGDLDLEVEVEATLEELRTTQLIIAAIRDATLANGGLTRNSCRTFCEQLKIKNSI